MFSSQKPPELTSPPVAGSANLRKDFLGSCAPQPSTLATPIPPEEQLCKVVQFVDEARQNEKEHTAWQEKVGTDLTGLRSSLASMEQQLSKMEALLQQGGGQDRPASKWGRLEYASAQLDGDGAVGGGGPSAGDLDSNVHAIKAVISQSAAQLGSSFERQMVAMDERVARQLDVIHKACADLREDNVRIESLFSEVQENTAKIPKLEGMNESAKAPQSELSLGGGDPLELEVEKCESSAVSAPGKTSRNPITTVLDRTSVLPVIARRGTAFDLSMGVRSVHLPEVAQCMLILQIASFWLIVCYMVFVGLSLSFSMPLHAKNGDELPQWIHFGDWMFLVAFMVELALRLSIERSRFFLSSSCRYWNAFDFIMTVVQLIEVLGLTFKRISLARSVKVVKLLRAARVLRQMKSFRSLRLIVSITVWQPLMWGAVSLILLTYVFSLFFAQLVTDWLVAEGHNTADASLLADLDTYYGNLRRTMIALFMAFTGGEVWAVLLRPLQKISMWCEPLFVAYIILTTCGMVKILGALFVDMVLFTSNRDHDMQMTEREKQDRELVYRLKQLIQIADSRNSGRVSRDAVMKVLSKQENKKVLKELGLELDMVKALFKLIDVEERNRIGIDEFCYGMLNMSADSHFSRNSMLMFQSKRTMDKLDLVAQIIGNRLHKLEKLIVQSSAPRDANSPDASSM